MAAHAPATNATFAAIDHEAGTRFADVYEEWFDEVVRWAGALGGPHADVDDIAQEVFLVAQRRLVSFDGRAPGAWLYAITTRVVANHRRRAWLRRVLLGEHRVETLAVTGLAADEAMERQETAREVWTLLSRLSRKRREALILFEIEGYSGEEIASLQGIPLNTVWTRLHHARREFLALAAENLARRGR